MFFLRKHKVQQFESKGMDCAFLLVSLAQPFPAWRGHVAALGGGRLHLGVPRDHTRTFLMHGRAAVPAWLSGE